jgi:hypothetical protein
MSDILMLEQLRATAASFRSSGDHGTAYLMECAAERIAAEGVYAELATETLEGIRDAIANGLKFDGAKWLLFESGRDAFLDRINDTLARAPKSENEIGTKSGPTRIECPNCGVRIAHPMIEALEERVMILSQDSKQEADRG